MLIGELAKATGTTKDTIRHYDQMGLLISTERQAGSRSYKDYSQDNIERLDMIRLAKYIGFTLTEIAEQVEKYYSGGISHEEQIRMLEARLGDVQQRVSQMQEVESYLQLKIELMKNGELVEPNSCMSLHHEVQEFTSKEQTVLLNPLAQKRKTLMENQLKQREIESA